jgi:GNAT superfamily N-acetyltransferase
VGDFTLQLTLDLARRIELSEAQAAVDGAETIERLQPGSGAAVEPIAGGFAIYCGPNSPVTQAVGLGLSGPVTDEEFDRLEAFYRSRNEPIRVETCPLADHSLIEQYAKRGYRVTEFSNVLARTLNGSSEKETWPAPPPEINIEKVENDKINLWTVTVSKGFADHFPVTKDLLNVMTMFARGPNIELYLAYVDGRVAGGGTLALRQGVAGLFGASTLSPFRRRGVQSALLRARLAQAAAAGCDLAVSLTQPGSISQRNIMRQGFEVLYTRVKFENGEGVKTN